jgi:predicted nucleotidyltransferase
MENIRAAVNALVTKEPKVKRVILFGSVTENRATPASDVDIVIVVTESTRSFHDRSPEFIAYFKDIGLGTDIFVYTQSEITENDIPLYSTALEHGRILHER